MSNDVKSDIDLLIETCGKLAANANALENRVKELENNKKDTLSVTDLSYLKEIIMLRAKEVSQQKYHINQQLEKNIIREDYHAELLVDIIEEERKIDETFNKINNQIIK